MNWKVVPLEQLAAREDSAIKIGPFGSQLRKCDLVPSGIHVVGIENVVKEKFNGFGERYITAEKFHSLRSVEVRSGDLLITMMGTVGEVAVVPPGTATSVMDSHLLRFRPNLEVCSPQFVAWLIKGSPVVRAAIQGRAHGAIMKGLNSSLIRTLPAPLPPLAEQERIVKLLDEADELRKLRVQADRHTAALIPSLFHEMFGDQNFPIVALRELATKERNSLTNGPFGSDLLSSELTDSGVPVIYIRDISSGNYKRKSTVCVTPAKAAELEFCNAKPGDVLVAKVGAPPGIAAVYPAKEPHAIVTQDVIRIRPNVERALSVYVEGFLNSSLGLEEVRNITIQATRQRFSLGQFKEINVPLPPLSPQKEFAARVSEIRAVQAEQAASRCHLDDLFQSLMYRAFKGEL